MLQIPSECRVYLFRWPVGIMEMQVVPLFRQVRESVAPVLVLLQWILNLAVRLTCRRLPGESSTTTLLKARIAPFTAV